MISTKELDKRVKRILAECIRPNLSPSAYNSARSKLREAENASAFIGLADEIRKIGEFCLQRGRMTEREGDVEFPMEPLLKVAREGFDETVQFVLSNSHNFFVDLPVETLMAIVKSPAVLDKIAKGRKGLLAEALSLFQTQPQLSSGLPGLLWVAKKAKIEQLFPLLPQLSDSTTGSAESLELLIALLMRDKSGKAIARLIALIAKSEISSERLVEGLRRSPIAAINFLRILPKLALKQYGECAADVFANWAKYLETVPDSERTVISGAVAALGGGLLQKKRLNSVEESILTSIRNGGERLCLQIRGDVDGFWALLPINRDIQSTSGSFVVSPEAARLFVESMLKLESGRYQASEVFEALALNFGLLPLGNHGAIVDYNPDQHEDAMGGLLRGQPAEVLRRGWTFQGVTILKSKVQPLATNS